MLLAAESPVLCLDNLRECVDAFTEEAAGFYKENAVVCLSDQGHCSGVEIGVEYDGVERCFGLEWEGIVDDRMARCYRDLVKAAEHGACAIALLLVGELTEFVAVEQAVRGNTVDYYLSRKEDRDELLFNQSARLEVSGILVETEYNTIPKRIGEKRRRLVPDENLPSIIVVVEFSQPMAVFEGA